MNYYIGTKQLLIKNILSKDETFITIFFKPLRGGDKSFIDAIFNHSTEFDFDRNEAAVTVNDITVSRAQLAIELSPAAPFLSNGLIMKFICLMFIWRDRKVSTNYSDVNRESASFTTLRSNVFLPGEIIQRYPLTETVSAEEVELRTYIHDLFDSVSSDQIGQLFMPCYIGEGLGRWILLVVNFIEGNLYYIDPTLIPHNAIPSTLPSVVRDTITSLTQLFRSARNKLDMEIDILSKAFTPWPHQYYAAFLPVDSGVAVASIIYFMINGCPLYLSCQNIYHARYNFAYWICCNGCLPY